MNAALSLSKYIKLKKVRIYDAIFILHSKCTMVILLTCSLLLSAKQYFGDPIQCMTDLQFMDFVNSYCWTFGTFLVSSAVNDSRNTIAVGVGPTSNKSGGLKIETMSLRYYQWVVIVLLLEAVLFYLPSYLWKMWEESRLDQLCSPVAKVLISPKARLEHCNALADYFNSDNSLVHRTYFAKYLTCELLNLSISISNIFFLDYFLNGYWSRYLNTLSALTLNDWHSWDYNASQVFPKLAKCTIYTFGLGGSINNYDALCMLPLNIINEKIFAFLWIWYALMFLLAFLKILYQCVILMCATLRAQLLRCRVRNISYFEVCHILNGRTFGDWYVLYKVSLNVNPLLMSDLLDELYDKSSGHKKYSHKSLATIILPNGTENVVR